MTENQNDQNVQGNQNVNQTSSNQNNQKKEGNPADKASEKTAVNEDEKVKPVPAEVPKEQEPGKHPHENSVPVGSINKNGSGL